MQNTSRVKRSLWTFGILAMIPTLLWAPVYLGSWTPESYPHDPGSFAALWLPVGDFTSVIQARRGQPTWFCSDFSAFGKRLEGRIRVLDLLGGNFVGFALGFQPGDTTNPDADYLLIDWKKSPSTISVPGLAVSRVTGIPSLDELAGHVSFDDPYRNSGLEELQRGATLGFSPWVAETDYFFTMEYTGSSLKIFVDGVLQIDIAGSFPDGNLCFYNYAQKAAIYGDVEVELLPCIDNDGDGYGSPGVALCPNGPANDCDDSDDTIFPGAAAEIPCDGIDNDCDPFTPEDPNSDGDPVSFCNGDCDDDDPARYPGNSEALCNGIDDDCNGATGDDVNADGDSVSLCQGDCDDSDPANFPGNIEVCDRQDNDCDSDVDEGFGDIDGDGVCDDVDNCPDDANADQTDFDGDGTGDACTACEPDPRGQGYWYRQCQGIPAADGGIDPGRQGRGPQEPLEANFDKSMGAVSLLLEDFHEFGGACAAGMDADPPSDKCEKALKQSTAFLFNLVTSKLSGSCTVDLTTEGCESTDLTTLVDELEGLINSRDEVLCQVASACAEAVNQGSGFESAAVVLAEVPQSLQGGTGPTTAAGKSDRVVEPAPAEPSNPAAVLLPQAQVPAITTQQPQAEDPSAEPSEHPVLTLRQHLAVVSNPSAPVKAVEISTDALLTALSGGYGPDLRMEIVRALLRKIDVAYHGLLAAHLEAIRAEAVDSRQDNLASQAALLLQKLEPSE